MANAKADEEALDGGSSLDDLVVPGMVGEALCEDWFLQNIVSLANMGIDMGVTLIVGGSIISGTLTSGRKYFEEMAAGIRDFKPRGDTPEVLDAMAATWERFASLYDDSKPNERPTYLHLKSAHFYAPSGQSLPGDKRGTLWRGRIASVDGFTFGSLSPK